MGDKQLERLLSEVTTLADRLSEDDDSLRAEEVSELLEAAGYRSDDLRSRLHKEVRALVTRLRKAGTTPPGYLREAADHTAPLEILAGRHPWAARQEMQKWLRSLASRVASGVSASPGDLAIARAYRRTSELSAKDAELLDELEDEVKARAGGHEDDSGDEDSQ